MADTEEEAAPVAAAGGKNKILPIILVVNTLLLTGVLVFVMKRPSATAGEGKEKGEKHEAAAAGGEHAAPGADKGLTGPMTRFENFTVQLKSAEVDRYARLSLELESPNDVSKGAVEKRVPPIRDAVIGYLTDRTAEELRGSEGLKTVKEALLHKMEEIVPGKHVRNIFITDFIIQ